MGCIDLLIGLAQWILDRGFGMRAFFSWRDAAFLCLLCLLGPLHHYTKNFDRFTRRRDEKALLAGMGVLHAARQEIANAAQASDPGPAGLRERRSLPFTPWFLRRKEWIPLTDLRGE
ncbi:MAG: hypothetical protein AB1646_06695 [Thermodesulfobacteriota bacterium]